MDLKVKNRTVVITGATQGIGAQTALQFAAEGAKVVITYRSQKEKAESVARAVENAGAPVLALYMDLGDEASIRNVAAETEKAFGGIDILINNAVRYQDAASKADKFETVSQELWQPVLRHTIEGTYLLTQLAVPHMRKNKWGRIVNVSSGIAAFGSPGQRTYGAAKAALHGLTVSLAKELGPDGILVNAILVGVVPGERDLDALPQAVRDHAIRNSAIGRLLTPEELGTIMVLFGSGANMAITGQIVSARGG